jgi:hypothetical protein
MVVIKKHQHTHIYIYIHICITQHRCTINKHLHYMYVCYCTCDSMDLCENKEPKSDSWLTFLKKLHTENQCFLMNIKNWKGVVLRKKKCCWIWALRSWPTSIVERQCFELCSFEPSLWSHIYTPIFTQHLCDSCLFVLTFTQILRYWCLNIVDTSQKCNLVEENDAESVDWWVIPIKCP